MREASKMDCNQVLETVDWDAFDVEPNTKAFLKRVYAAGLGRYERRLASLTFPGGAAALDAGCGLGQWSMVLSGMCDVVRGVDVSSERVRVCQTLASSLGISNAQFVQASLEKLPFADASFDRVICYSVLYLTNYEEAIGELARVSRPGGLLYISTNGIGRYVFDVVRRPNPAADFDPRRYGLRSIVNTLRGRRQGLSPENGGVAMRRARTARSLESNGFEVVECGEEGRLLGYNDPFFAGRYLGLVSAFDILARKK